MPVTTAEAFEKRHITRDDGVSVLPRPMITAAALEAGYHLPSPMINDAVCNTTYPGQMTCEEFAAFCEEHQESFVSARELAKAVVVVAPSNVITRASLEAIINKSSTPEAALSEEEVDALFQTLDTENKGAITGDEFMSALHGDDGVLCLHEQRHADAKEAEERLREKAAREARRAEEERKKAEAEAKAKAQAATKKLEEEKAKVEKQKKASACC